MGGEEEITGGRTLQLAFIMRLGLSDDSPVTDDEKNTNSVCVSPCSVGFASCWGMSRGASEGREIRRNRYQSCTNISPSLTAGFILIIGFSDHKRRLSRLGSCWQLPGWLGENFGVKITLNLCPNRWGVAGQSCIFVLWVSKQSSLGYSFFFIFFFQFAAWFCCCPLYTTESPWLPLSLR